MEPTQAAPCATRFRGAIRGATPLLAILAGLLLVLLTACGGNSDAAGKGGAGDHGGNGKASQAAASDAVVSISPKNGAKNVATSGALTVTAKHGKLSSVAVKDAAGNAVTGELSASKQSWKPADHLRAATKYTVDAIAEDAKGRQAAQHTIFTTVVPKDTFIGYYTPEEGDTVGVGMEVSVTFNRAITRPDAVANAISVTAEPQVPVEGHWFGNQRLDFRPEHYWASGTKVTLSLRLDGVEGADGVYGQQSKDVHFTIGRNQVSVVDAAKHTMKVTRDGEVIKTIPITAGGPGTTTYNGKMVITEKHLVTRMDGWTVGFAGEYDIKDVPHAMRLTTSGTFIHGNYWTASSTFGSANASHGCVGLRDVRGAGDSGTPAAWFYNKSLIGDVVEVRNSNDTTVAPDNGLNGWNMSWADWTAEQ